MLAPAAGLAAAEVEASEGLAVSKTNLTDDEVEDEDEDEDEDEVEDEDEEEKAGKKVFLTAPRFLVEAFVTLAGATTVGVVGLVEVGVEDEEEEVVVERRCFFEEKDLNLK
jgi:hypothetical protein